MTENCVLRTTGLPVCSQIGWPPTAVFVSVHFMYGVGHARHGAYIMVIADVEAEAADDNNDDDDGLLSAESTRSCM